MEKTGWRQLLRERNVRWLFAGQLISQVGEGVSKVALLWFVEVAFGCAEPGDALGTAPWSWNCRVTAHE